VHGVMTFITLLGRGRRLGASTVLWPDDIAWNGTSKDVPALAWSGPSGPNVLPGGAGGASV